MKIGIKNNILIIANLHKLPKLPQISELKAVDKLRLLACNPPIKY